MKKWDNLLSTSFLIKRLNNPYILRGDGDTYTVAVVPHVVGVDKDIFVPVRKHGQVVMVSFVEDEFHFTRQTAVLPVQGIEPGSAVQVEVDFQHVILEDNEEDGRLTGEVKFILYKGNHYHLTVFTDWDEDIFVDTNDVWDDGDRVGITIAPQNIRIVQSLNKEGSAQ
jgi:uncharacterized protein YuzE